MRLGLTRCISIVSAGSNAGLQRPGRTGWPEVVYCEGKSPAHAAEIGGPVHSKMENWIDGSRIDLRSADPEPRDIQRRQAYLGR